MRWLLVLAIVGAAAAARADCCRERTSRSVLLVRDEPRIITGAMIGQLTSPELRRLVRLDLDGLRLALHVDPPAAGWPAPHVIVLELRFDGCAPIDA